MDRLPAADPLPIGKTPSAARTIPPLVAPAGLPRVLGAYVSTTRRLVPGRPSSMLQRPSSRGRGCLMLLRNRRHPTRQPATRYRPRLPNLSTVRQETQPTFRRKRFFRSRSDPAPTSSRRAARSGRSEPRSSPASGRVSVEAARVGPSTLPVPRSRRRPRRSLMSGLTSMPGPASMQGPASMPVPTSMQRPMWGSACWFRSVRSDAGGVFHPLSRRRPDVVHPGGFPVRRLRSASALLV